MLKIHQLKNKSFLFQCRYLERQGVYLDVLLVRRTAFVALYGVHDYYAELHFDRQSGKVVRICCFTSARKLQPFLQRIDIGEVTTLLATR
ncbi:hypothetical protein V9K67_14385 [Paraflavisolibacter sp. H34]|uniref:hypothetical protein n=1 Tax=Huijunlia imazamoxiresistens TaxID=3127457 RepID=UPI003015EFDC